MRKEEGEGNFGFWIGDFGMLELWRGKQRWRGWTQIGKQGDWALVLTEGREGSDGRLGVGFSITEHSENTEDLPRAWVGTGEGCGRAGFWLLAER